jgi:hypothetical protein
MSSSGMSPRVTLVRTDISVERSASIIRVTRIDEVGTTLGITSSMRWSLVMANIVPSSPILVTLMMEALRSSETCSYKRHMALTSQKTTFSIVTAVKTSNLTYKSYRRTALNH